jgi:hypothetical protein
MARRLFALAVLVLAAWSAPRATAGDDPVPVKPPPAPPTLTRDGSDLLDALLDQLTSSDADVRRRADEELAAASADTLRALVHRLQARALAGAPPAALSPTTVAVDQEVRWALAKPDDVKALLGVSAAGADPALVAATPALVKRWSDAAEAGTIELVSAPRLTTYDGQKGTVEVLDQRSYVADYDLQVSSGASIADPIVETVQSGSMLGLTARVQPDRSRISVAIDADLRRLVEPMAEEKIELMKGSKPVVVQRPEIIGSRWQRTLSITPGGSAFVVFPSGFYAPADRRLVLEYTANVVELPVPAAPPNAKPVGSPPSAPGVPPKPTPQPK